MSLFEIIDEKRFELLVNRVLAGLRPKEHLVLGLTAERSHFIRLNRALVRQTGMVSDAELSLKLILEGAGSGSHRQASASISLTGNDEQDPARLLALLGGLRAEAANLPCDPFTVLPKNNGSSSERFEGRLLSPAEAAGALIPPIQGVDLAGIYASGISIRANANSSGQKHWFETENFCFDYSLITASERAVKGSFAGRTWDSDRYRANIAEAREKFSHLERPSRKIARGAYRVYLAPDSVARLVGMLAWRGIGESGIRQGDSPLIPMREGKKAFSPLFNLYEDFAAGGVPRFNDEGEVAPKTLALIENGKLKNTLISSRTALEYGIESNAADGSEMLRSPAISPGKLTSGEILSRLGTGLYLSNLHYLNCSDRQTGRITGMTRYACFWVEDGKIQAPIENMRFDETLYRVFGSELEALTEFTQDLPSTSTYRFRQLGMERMPGALVRSMEFTL